ncbi:MAG TPA: hypothetical protein PLZ84_06620 [Clostridia bacterium]|nr:hypothetical protein [Clostridia bacterium]
MKIAPFKKIYPLYLILIVLIIGVGAAILWKYMAPPKTITEICGVKRDDIVLQDGDNGKEAEITDKNEIANILGKINVNKYSYLDSKKYNGFIPKEI